MGVATNWIQDKGWNWGCSLTLLTRIQGFVFTTLSQRSDTQWVCEISDWVSCTRRHYYSQQHYATCLTGRTGTAASWDQHWTQKLRQSSSGEKSSYCIWRVFQISDKHIDHKHIFKKLGWKFVTFLGDISFVCLLCLHWSCNCL